jgi:1-acyl-sn-glycerol-3-phosphate acyltransferase
MRDAARLLLAILRLAFFVVNTLVAMALVLVVSFRDPDGGRAYAVARWWAWLNVRCGGVRVEVDGLEHLDPAASYVFMSNHRSVFDVLTLVVALWDFQLRWVAKAELRRIPVFGLCLKVMKQIFVDRRDHAAAVASLAEARRRLRNGVSVACFPEGTRSAGDMLPFKKGGFVFAIETGMPIVPIGIRDAGRLFGRDGTLGRLRRVVHVEVRRPIGTTALTLDDRDLLLARVRRTIAAAVRTTAPPSPAQGGVLIGSRALAPGRAPR